MSATFEPMVGRYMHLDLFGRAHRIYVEEAGQGTSLLCLHTAGSDGRQYRGLMNHPGITANHRVIAFDMPWHGKSSPPAGWQDEEYRAHLGAIHDHDPRHHDRSPTRQADRDGLLDRRTHRAASGAGTS
jgi:pimeloyl-ACP methyl ester carboxylesterase